MLTTEIRIFLQLLLAVMAIFIIMGPISDLSDDIDRAGCSIVVFIIVIGVSMGIWVGA